MSTIPKIREAIDSYREMAKTERMKTGRPCARTVANNVFGTRKICEAAGISLDEPVTALTRQRIDAALARLHERGIQRITVLSYVEQTHALFARWTRPYYEDAGWVFQPPEMPVFVAKAPRYERPSAELLKRVQTWYRKLTAEWWFAATMMLEFAMRNGDVLRLKESNFVTTKKGHFLSYTPHKTANSSGRRVFWPIHDSIWQKFEDYGRLSGLDVTEETFRDLNRDLRALGFTGSKASYELRKICIDHIYQKFGAETAVAISGDDIKTISRYYADLCQAYVDPVLVVDLLS